MHPQDSYYERWLRQLEQLEEMARDTNGNPNLYVALRIGALAKWMQEERRHAYDS
jgi:hypothetical protein